MRAECAATFATLESETKHIRSTTDEIKETLAELKHLILGEELDGGLVGMHKALQKTVAKHAVYWSISIFLISSSLVAGIGAIMYFTMRR